ncbi:class I SAM-dependent methyltransferase [Methanobacterium sp.]|uniref:class I SAM-dependent methyltransferase n=1 Tax=Methanobacterium sp. TaxID=2164 RepID=UPI003C773129
MMCILKKDWNKKDTVDFWEKNEADYAGDIAAQEILKISKKYIGNKVLDIGAGSGALIKLIPNSIGLDIAPKQPDIIKGDISDMPFEDQSFDTVFATEVLEHLDSDTLSKGITEVNRILKNGGHLIVTVPYNENLRQNMVLCPDCGTKFHRWGHIQVFNEENIKLLLKDDFKLIKIKKMPIGFNATHNFLKYLRWLIERFGFLKEQNLFLVAKK